MMKKILVVDDSALMRRVFCDIINSDERYEVADTAANGREALELLGRKRYDAVVLDVNMPEMTGLQLLEELRRRRIPARVMMASTATREGAKITLQALELGALDFIHKPSAVGLRLELFKSEMLMTLDAVANGRMPSYDAGKASIAAGRAADAGRVPEGVSGSAVGQTAEAPAPVRRSGSTQAAQAAGSRIVAIASSTGGPKALQSVIPKLPAKLNAPVLLVQHMPEGFTASLADRLNGLSEICVKEAVEGEELKNGVVYIARGGLHMNVQTLPGGRAVIRYSDAPLREGVRPCANYTYESLASSRYDQVICVVMTGMGADGTEGIRRLKAVKPVHVIAQDQESCVVYGMPKSVKAASLADRTVPLEQIADEIVTGVGLA